MSESAVFDISKVYAAVLENGHSKAAAPSKSLMTMEKIPNMGQRAPQKIFLLTARRQQVRVGE